MLYSLRFCATKPAYNLTVTLSNGYCFCDKLRTTSLVVVLAHDKKQCSTDREPDFPVPSAG
jgi:hypothetical protein